MAKLLGQGPAQLRLVDLQYTNTGCFQVCCSICAQQHAHLGKAQQLLQNTLQTKAALIVLLRVSIMIEHFGPLF